MWFINPFFFQSKTSSSNSKISCGLRIVITSNLKTPNDASMNFRLE